MKFTQINYGVSAFDCDMIYAILRSRLSICLPISSTKKFNKTCILKNENYSSYFVLELCHSFVRIVLEFVPLYFVPERKYVILINNRISFLLNLQVLDHFVVHE